ncbi:MAG: hypothetical protein O7H41_21710 [Planctomycetota bacterium]|nr:hypothetical protein [Planctomycetota bacterium]
MHALRRIGSYGVLLCAIALAVGCGGGQHGGSGGAGDIAPPTITIETPTTGPTYETDHTPITVAGTATGAVSIARVTWHNDTTGDSGLGQGTDSWSASIPLAVGTNLITVTAHDPSGRQGQAALMVTVRPGSLKAWGHNGWGQVGDGTMEDRVLPVDVIGLSQVIDIAASDNHTVALRVDGTVWTWGNNFAGQLGDGTQIDRPFPGQVVDLGDPSGYLTGVIDVAAGPNYGNHTIALKADGTLRAWGSNWWGQCGDGTIGNIKLEPIQVLDPGDPSGYLTGVAAITAGDVYTGALKRDGTAWSIGGSTEGVHGDGTTESRSLPVQVVDLADPTGYLQGIEQISGTGRHVLALMSDGTVRAWGRNANGQLGIGQWTWSSLVPVPVVDPTDPSGVLTGVTAVAAGSDHSLALLQDGTVRSWGHGQFGQLGNDDTPSWQLTPVPVLDPSDATGLLQGVIAIAAGEVHSMAILIQGDVKAWGDNFAGQIGDGTRDNMRLTPVHVLDPADPSGFLTGVSAIAAGYHTVALRNFSSQG